MKKKVSILSLVIVFFVSTTSLPVTIYFCHMTNTFSLDKCPMEMSSEMPQGESCSPAAINDHDTQSINNNCCTVKTVDSSVKDNYLITHPDINNNLTVIAAIAVPVSVENLLTVQDNKIYFDTSPPLLSSNSLYLTNSVLLI